MFDWIGDFFTAQVLGPIIGIVVTAIIGWLAALYARVTGKQLEAMHREALQSALENGMKWAIQQVLKGKLTPTGTVPEDAKAAVISKAQDYVVESVPDALRHFGLSKTGLTTLLTPKLPISPPESLVSK